MTADELLHKFDVFLNSHVRTDRRATPTALPFGRSVVPVEFIFFQQLVHSTCPVRSAYHFRLRLYRQCWDQ